jgi:hypothetical protein
MSMQQKGGRTDMQLPNMVSNKGIREGKAADGVMFKVCDFIIHPEALSQCLTKPALLDTALIMVSILPICQQDNTMRSVECCGLIC